MRVNIQSNRGPCMTELRLNVFYVFPLLDQKACERVPKIMKPYPRDLRLLEGWEKIPLEKIIMINRVSFGIGSDMPFDSQLGDRFLRQTIESIERMEIPDFEKKMIFEDNARKLLRLPV